MKSRSDGGQPFLPQTVPCRSSSGGGSDAYDGISDGASDGASDGTSGGDSDGASDGTSGGDSDAPVEDVSNDDIGDLESYYLAGGSGIGTSIGPSGTMNLAIFIVAAMVATVVGAIMVTVYVRSVFPGCPRWCSFAISFLIPRLVISLRLAPFLSSPRRTRAEEA